MKGIAVATTLLACVAIGRPQSTAPGLFSDDERSQILAFWSAPGRTSIAPWSDPARGGPWQVRLTADGSLWLWNYNKARGIGKTPPNQVPGAQNEEQRSWEAWIDAKVARDRWEAGKLAESMNAALSGRLPDANPLANPEPPIPGPIPDGLFALGGNPPNMAVAVVPLTYQIDLGEGRRSVLTDHPAMAPRYAYYRFPQGVMLGGRRLKDLPQAELNRLFEAAGVSAKERKAMAAVSSLEGGFESVNTYDTGFVSVGFIQFACLQGGSGSLGKLLLQYKANQPEAFQSDFHRFGVDVSPEGSLVVVDPATGAEVSGQSAARKIIDDKRLIAVFQVAGASSEPFRVAQIAAAKGQFLPSADSVSLTIGSKTLSGKLSDVFRSEAGLATLMDRKVNTGNLEPITDLLAVCAEECGADSLADLAKYERDLCVALRYRKDFLADASLGQPGPAVNSGRDYKALASRRASRNSRKGGG
ncbi:MAG: hypothetical protein HZC36_10785 [Armatimonadetes bacterium]|nr:hypothetical protein [Armatimonadota bacterium]